MNTFSSQPSVKEHHCYRTASPLSIVQNLSWSKVTIVMIIASTMQQTTKGITLQVDRSDVVWIVWILGGREKVFGAWSRA